jgi:hypothetical protein
VASSRVSLSRSTIGFELCLQVPARRGWVCFELLYDFLCLLYFLGGSSKGERLSRSNSPHDYALIVIQIRTYELTGLLR